jgi:subtilisin family serine protease
MLFAIPTSQPSSATASSEMGESEQTSTSRAFASYIVLLEAAPAAAFYASMMEDAEAQSASISALTQAHLASIEQAQLQLVERLESHEAQVLYRVQRVLNGIAIHAPVDQIEAIAALPGVQGVYPLIPKEPSNARIDTLLDASAIWLGANSAGLTGKGISIAIIDTGIDYLHTMFGGPGTGYLSNDSDIIGDAANFPGAKIIGGYDFAGDSYDASPTSSKYQPVPRPDPDPMECYGTSGHGTHVAGTAAGYGVLADGATYPGPYDSSIDLNALRIGPGLAPEASIYALKVFGCTGSSNIVDAAVEWAVDPNQDGDFSDHVDVINLSLGSSFGSAFDATTVAVENAARLGVIVVTSAGNSGDVHYAIGSPGVATPAIAVAATSINSATPGELDDGVLAIFSARGPRRGDDALKPDIAAPGVNVTSAKRGTGNQSATISGTSMASPVVAGVMALLRQAHPEAGIPGWRSHELKALAMNTAVYPLLPSDIGRPYSLARAGAGRIDPSRALQSRLIAYDADTPELVSVSFGSVEVLDQTTAVRSIRLANKGTVPISVTVTFTSVRDLPGVTIDVGAGKLITVPALGFATTPVTVTATAAEMMRQADPTRQLTPVDAHPWADEASGTIIFTPVITTSGRAIHLPIYALPRVVSALTAQSPLLDLGDSISATIPLTITGSAITGGVAPTHTVPLMGVFALAHSSPPLKSLPSGEPLLGRFAQADLRYIGIAGPMEVDGERLLYFALVSYGPWSTPLEMTYHIAIDTDGDNIIDFRLQNRERTDLTSVDFGSTDDFVSMLEPIVGNRKVQGPLNLYRSTQFDTRSFDNNVMVLPLRLDDLGSDVDFIRYQVTSTSRDLTESAENIEQTPVLSLPLNVGAAIVSDKELPLFPVAAGDAIAITFDRAAYARQQSKGLLLLYLHNELSGRTQTLPVAYDWVEHHYLPAIRRE